MMMLVLSVCGHFTFLRNVNLGGFGQCWQETTICLFGKSGRSKAQADLDNGVLTAALNGDLNFEIGAMDISVIPSRSIWKFGSSNARAEILGSSIGNMSAMPTGSYVDISVQKAGSFMQSPGGVSSNKAMFERLFDECPDRTPSESKIKRQLVLIDNEYDNKCSGKFPGTVHQIAWAAREASLIHVEWKKFRKTASKSPESGESIELKRKLNFSTKKKKTEKNTEDELSCPEYPGKEHPKKVAEAEPVVEPEEISSENDSDESEDDDFCFFMGQIDSQNSGGAEAEKDVAESLILAEDFPEPHANENTPMEIEIIDESPIKRVSSLDDDTQPLPGDESPIKRMSSLDLDEDTQPLPGDVPTPEKAETTAIDDDETDNVQVLEASEASSSTLRKGKSTAALEIPEKSTWDPKQLLRLSKKGSTENLKLLGGTVSTGASASDDDAFKLTDQHKKRDGKKRAKGKQKGRKPKAKPKAKSTKPKTEKVESSDTETEDVDLVEEDVEEEAISEEEELLQEEGEDVDAGSVPKKKPAKAVKAAATKTGEVATCEEKKTSPGKDATPEEKKTSSGKAAAKKTSLGEDATSEEKKTPPGKAATSEKKKTSPTVAKDKKKASPDEPEKKKMKKDQPPPFNFLQGVGIPPSILPDEAERGRNSYQRYKYSGTGQVEAQIEINNAKRSFWVIKFAEAAQDTTRRNFQGLDMSVAWKLASKAASGCNDAQWQSRKSK